jgi:hypothetical protein
VGGGVFDFDRVDFVDDDVAADQFVGFCLRLKLVNVRVGDISIEFEIFFVRKINWFLFFKFNRKII